MNAVAYKTKDGLICIAPAPFNDWEYRKFGRRIKRMVCPPPHAWNSKFLDEATMDIITREYEYQGQRNEDGFPIFQEV